jgi:hypothetical protein
LSPATEVFARAINVGFDQLMARQRATGQAEAVEAAKASAFAAIAFLDQTVGRVQTLQVIGELIDA